MFVLLPPSEGKSPSAGTAPFGDALPSFKPDTDRLLKHLARLKSADRFKFYGLRDPEKTLAAHRLTGAALESPGMPALERYTGVVYTHLDYASLPKKADARKRLLVVSALFGLIPGGAPIPDYKLSMTPWLARYWKGINTGRLMELAGDTPVLDLLSQSYRKALDHPGLITVDFRTHGGKKAAGHFGKAIKGRFVRWVIAKKIQQISDFDGFTEDGYRFDGRNFVQA